MKINNIGGYMNKIEELLFDNEKESEGFINDVAMHGCINGTVNELIYYNDTCKFYEENKDLIWEIISDYAQETGQNIFEFETLRKCESATIFENNMTWLAVDLTASKLSHELEQPLTDSHGNEIG
tara:strand:- start:111 stop:485 length:375 start_codon:yes stop_codon:yes gene_type:complete